MGNQQANVQYTASDMAFFTGHPQKAVDKHVLMYLVTRQKTLSGTLHMQRGVWHSFDLFSTEPAAFMPPAEQQPFLLRLGIFLVKDNIIHLVADGLKPLGLVLPKTFTINGGDVQQAGAYTYHAFSYPENGRGHLPVPFPINLFVTHESALAKRG